jgi:hypothetical protein
MKQILDSPPNAVVLGCQAHIVSSTHTQGEQLTLVDLIKLNCSTVLENAHQGSLSFLLSSAKNLGKKLSKIFEMAECHKLLKLWAGAD